MAKHNETPQKPEPGPQTEQKPEPQGVTYIVNGVRVDPNGKPVRG